MSLIEAPKGRYRVEERGGRLIVIDTLTGAQGSGAVMAAADLAARRAGAGNQPLSAKPPEAPRAATPAAPPAKATGITKAMDPAEQTASYWLGHARDGQGRLILAMRGRAAVALEQAEARKLGNPLLMMAIVGAATLMFMIAFFSVFPMLLGAFALFRIWTDWYVKTRDSLIAQGNPPAQDARAS